MLSTMNISCDRPSWRSILRMHLWRRLQQRMEAAQHNPTLLALLEQEANALDLQEIHSRQQRTIASLQHLRVIHR